MLLTSRIVKLLTKFSDQRELVAGSGMEAPIGWRPTRRILDVTPHWCYTR